MEDRQLCAPGTLQRLRARDPESWRQLVRVYTPLVFHWCLSSGLGFDDTADIVQDVFRAVAVGIARFQPRNQEDSFRGWLRTITTNKLRDHFRLQKNRPEALGGADARRWMEAQPEPFDSEDEEHVPPSAVEFQRALEHIRCEFEDRTWQAFWRATVDGHATAEIAAALGMTPNAVRKAKSRVLHRFRAILAEFDARDAVRKLEPAIRSPHPV